MHSSKQKPGPQGTTLLHSFARLKPMSVDGKTVDRVGGAAASKQIDGFDEAAGAISCGGQLFEHPEAIVGPDATQAHVYTTVAQPLVRKFIEGYDVDIISYGQTGSGKTFTMFGPPLSMEKAANALGVSGDDVILPEHGFILRSGLEALQAVSAMNGGGGGGSRDTTARCTLHGSMVEMSIMTLTNQSVVDLINNRKTCFVDKSHHLQGAVMIPLQNVGDVVRMAAAVETRLVRGTKMNDTSSRSHCCAVFTLSVAEGDKYRQSRLQIFDLMGSERFKGGNSAHNSGVSSKSSAGGWEGIYANLSLSSLMSAVDQAAKQRRKGSNKKQANAMLDMCLTDLLAGSLHGNAITAMVTCLSQSPRNGGESYLTLKYGAGMASLLNIPKPSKYKPLGKSLDRAIKEFKSVQAIVKKGVNGKYQALRNAQLTQWQQEVALLRSLESGESGESGESEKSGESGGGGGGTAAGGSGGESQQRRGRSKETGGMRK